MTRYVVGLLFDPSERELVLIQKTHPAWQAGKFNGPGGKVQPGETMVSAMTREFLEETGLEVRSWHPVCVRRDATSEVSFFMAHGDVSACRTMTSEPVLVVRIADLPLLSLVENLRWIVPLALHRENGYVTVSVE